MSRDPNFTTIHSAAHLGEATLGLGNYTHDVCMCRIQSHLSEPHCVIFIMSFE